MNSFGLKGIVIEVLPKITKAGRPFHIVRLRTEPRNSGSVTASVPVFSEPPRIGDEVSIRGFIRETAPGSIVLTVRSVRPVQKHKRNRREESEP